MVVSMHGFMSQYDWADPQASQLDGRTVLACIQTFYLMLLASVELQPSQQPDLIIIRGK